MRRDWQEKVDKWKRWIQIVHDDVSQLAFRRVIWDELVNVIDRNDQIQKPSAFYDWLPAVYAPAQVMGIRRIADVDLRSKPTSLGNLLTDMNSNPEIVRTFSEENPLAIGDSSRTRRIPDPCQDLARLSRTVEPVKNYSDKRVAHLDGHGARHLITYGDISNAISLVSELTIDYYAFLRDSHYEVEPTFAYDWQQIFYVPWIPQGEPEDDDILWR